MMNTATEELKDEIGLINTKTRAIQMDERIIMVTHDLETNEIYGMTNTNKFYVLTEKEWEQHNTNDPLKLANELLTNNEWRIYEEEDN